MKVVLFCGGLGMRLREYSESIPKPMVNIGSRPILWHLMKYYAYHGHKEFILCLGHQAEVVKNYFRNYDECASNDFVLSGGGKKLELFNRDIDEWQITFADTGINSNLGERLRAVKKYLEGEEEFPVFSVSGRTSATTWFLCWKAKNAWFLRFTPSIMVQCVSTGAFSSSKSKFLIISARKKS